MKVVLDSSVLISAFLTPDNPSGVLVRAGLNEQFEICVSSKILDEMARTLRSKSRLRDATAIQMKRLTDTSKT